MHTNFALGKVVDMTEFLMLLRVAPLRGLPFHADATAAQVDTRDGLDRVTMTNVRV
jgi:hypothetical protein